MAKASRRHRELLPGARHVWTDSRERQASTSSSGIEPEHFERARDRVRGFYVDIEATVPGPLLATTREVIEALRDLDAVAARYADARRRFVERFCPFDDGAASARVVDAVCEPVAAA